MSKTILDLCGGTGSWSRPYVEMGYDVIVVDPHADCDTGAEIVRKDIRLWVPPKGIHGVLAAPPCTDLAASGARWWAQKGEDKLLEALSIADACMRIILLSNPEWWILENPIGRLARFYGRPKLTFDPWEYGHPSIKKTCFWGDFTVPPKTPVEPVLGQVVWRMGMRVSGGRAKMRSMTPYEVAKAFAEANT